MLFVGGIKMFCSLRNKYNVPLFSSVANGTSRFAPLCAAAVTFSHCSARRSPKRLYGGITFFLMKQKRCRDSDEIRSFFVNL